MKKFKKNLQVCLVVNDVVRELGRDHTLFYTEFTKYLCDSHNVTIISEFENAHIGIDYELAVDKGVSIRVHDCEYILEDLDENVFYILSSHDQISPAVLDQKSNPKLKKVLYSQFIPEEILHHTKQFYYKYSPWIYFKFSQIDLEEVYTKRIEVEKYIDKLHFKGSIDYRPIVKLVDDKIINDLTLSLPLSEYYDDLIQHKVALAVGGAANGDLCYRDIELMQIGVPFIKFEYIAKLASPLIPNYHYISIPVPNDMPVHNSVVKDRLGEKQHADMIVERFIEVKDDIHFLNTVSKNARKYYQDNLSTTSRITRTLELLNFLENE